MEDYNIIQDLINRAKRDAEAYDLAGLTVEEGTHPYDHLIRLFKDAIVEVNILKGHVHKWNENGYCMICGADGRA